MARDKGLYTRMVKQMFEIQFLRMVSTESFCKKSIRQPLKNVEKEIFFLTLQYLLYVRKSPAQLRKSTCPSKKSKARPASWPREDIINHNVLVLAHMVFFPCLYQNCSPFYPSPQYSMLLILSQFTHLPILKAWPLKAFVFINPRK